jgi:hypothetical protein
MKILIAQITVLSGGVRSVISVSIDIKALELLNTSTRRLYN